MNPSDNSQPNFLKVCQSIQANWPAELWGKKNVMVAVSGGPDSVLLLSVLSRIHKHRTETGELIVCHVDHSIRETSAADAKFVERLAEQHGLKLVSKCLAPIHSDSRSTSEDAMRQARYELFMKMADACGARYLVTGHNLDDQVETALFRVFRGTGFHGLRGIPFLRVQGAVSIVRPLLQVPRQTILAALEEIEQLFCTDPTNQTSNYTRNFLRNDVLPRLRERFPALDDSVLKLTRQAAELEQYLESEAETFSDALIDINDRELKIIKSKLENAQTIVIRQLLTRVWRDRGWPRQDMNRNWWSQLSDLAKDKSERSVLNLPGDIRVESDPQELRLKIQTPSGKDPTSRIK